MKRRVAAFREARYETSPPTISASDCGRSCAAGRLAHRFGARLSVASGALDRLFCGGHPNDIVARIIVQPLRKGGYGFNIKTNPYSWLTLHYETKEAAEEGLIDALRATEKRR